MPRTVSLTITDSPIVEPEIDPYDALVRTEAYLDGVNRDLERLRSEQQEASRLVEEQRRIVKTRCTVQRLSGEVLYEIFHIVVQDYTLGRRFNVTQDIWAIAAVCQRWRNICLEHPRLWRYINLDPSWTHQCRREDYNAVAALRIFLQLERSRDVALVVDASRLCACTSQVTSFRAIVAHCHRWEKAVFHHLLVDIGRGETGLEFFNKHIPANSTFTSLRHLVWDVDWNVDGIFRLPSFDCSSLASLNSLKISGTVQDFAQPDFPWTSLTHLCIKKYRGGQHELVSILSLSQQLLSLELAVELLQDDASILPADVVLPQLTNFGYTASANIQSLSCIKSFQLPSLRRASFRGFSKGRSIQLITDLIQRSSCSASLNELSLTSLFPSNQAALVTLLRLCPSLDILALAYQSPPDAATGTNDASLRSLIVGQGCASLCPRLRELHLIGVNVEPSTLMQVLDSRLSSHREKSIQSLQRLLWILPEISHSDEDIQTYKFCKKMLDQRYSNSGLNLAVYSMAV